MRGRNLADRWNKIGGLSIVLLVSFLGQIACTPEEEIITDDPSVQLRFSKDTIQFDTLFTTKGSISEWIWVYNPHPQAVDISSVVIGRGSESPYTLFLNGEPGQQFEGIRLRGNDSLFLVVEVLIDPQDQNLPFLEKDSLVFEVSGNQQDVKLVAWGQDAYFHRGWVITEDTHLAGDRPFVIQDSLWIAPGTTVTVDSGARFYFDNNAFALIGGSLRTFGTVRSPVVFRNVRTDGAYENAFGQWEGITFTASSQNNLLQHTKVRNAINGIVINTPDPDTIPDLVLANTMIENMAGYGVLAIGSDIDAYNTLIHSCILGLTYNVGNGYYRYRHCTFDNSALGYSREDEWIAVAFSELLPDQLATLDISDHLFRAELSNSILWGSLADELLLLYITDDTKPTIVHNLLKSTNDSLGDNIYNQDPLFVDPVISQYQLDTLSPAIDQGVKSAILNDLNDSLRDDTPDLGAYEYQKF